MTTPRTITADEIRIGQNITVRCTNRCRGPWTGFVTGLKQSPGKPPWRIEFAHGHSWSGLGACDEITLLEDAPTERDEDDALYDPRPEHVVKAEALREMAAHWERKGSEKQSLAYWELMGRADELDPPVPAQPAEPKGLGAVVEADCAMLVHGVRKTFVHAGRGRWMYQQAEYADDDLDVAWQQLNDVTVLSEGWTGDQT